VPRALRTASRQPVLLRPWPGPRSRRLAWTPSLESRPSPPSTSTPASECYILGIRGPVADSCSGASGGALTCGLTGFGTPCDPAGCTLVGTTLRCSCTDTTDNSGPYLTASDIGGCVGNNGEYCLGIASHQSFAPSLILAQRACSTATTFTTPKRFRLIPRRSRIRDDTIKSVRCLRRRHY
jgi:hypothetical protein